MATKKSPTKKTATKPKKSPAKKAVPKKAAPKKTATKRAVRPAKPPADPQRAVVMRQLAAAVAAAEDKKAEDIRVLALDPSESALADYFLICSGNSDRQNAAIVDEIELRLKREFSTSPTSVEGRRSGEWVLMDYVDFIVHVFTPEKRAFYGLERLRKSATVVLHAELK